MSTVFSSRRVWTAIIAMIVNVATILIGIYVKDPDYTKLAIVALTGFDSLAAIIVGLLTVDDINGIKAKQAVELEAVKQGTHPDYQSATLPEKPV